MHFTPPVSIVINTNGRLRSLQRTLDGLRRLKYEDFEVCLVTGPTDDGSREFAAKCARQGQIKLAHCEQLNLSKSRNIGIGIAAGDLVAFIDDDAIPQPEWLSDLVLAASDSDIGGVGGFTYDHTGYEFQVQYLVSDRFGDSTKIGRTFDSNEFSYPLATKFSSLLGTNSLFRRAALASVGGFDEQYEYYLDETDLCCRLIDAGWKICQIKGGYVHHSFLPSHVRNVGRAVKAPYPVLKNRIYFPLVNNKGHHTLSEVIESSSLFISQFRDNIQRWVRDGLLAEEELDAFEKTADLAWKNGLEAGLRGDRLIQDAEFFETPRAFQKFQRLSPAGIRLNLVFVCQSYPPDSSGGTSRYTYDIATAVAASGHDVHVLTRGKEFSRVDFEDGVWVHRVVPDIEKRPTQPENWKVPDEIWAYSSAMLEEARRIDLSTPIDAIEATSWDCEAAAFIFDGRFSCTVNLVTGLHQFLDAHPELAQDEAWLETFGLPMISLERLILERADHLIAATRAIALEVENRHCVQLASDRVSICPHGLSDWVSLPRTRPLLAASSESSPTLLFTGRLEHRKGIDLLLAALPDLISQHPDLKIWIAGDDSQTQLDGRTIRETFSSSPVGRLLGSQVIFLGKVEEEELRWLYANATIFVAPSRFESFGLVFLEAMMFAKPTVGCSVGGVPEVVDDGRTGLLIPTDDVGELAAALMRLLNDASLRSQLGGEGRRVFEERFAISSALTRRLSVLGSVSRKAIPAGAVHAEGETNVVDVEQASRSPSKATALGLDASLHFTSSSSRVFISFWTHPWSGVARVEVEGSSFDEDLFSRVSRVRTIALGAEPGSRVSIQRPGRANAVALGSEVLIVKLAELHPAKANIQ